MKAFLAACFLLFMLSMGLLLIVPGIHPHAALPVQAIAAEATMHIRYIMLMAITATETTTWHLLYKVASFLPGNWALKKFLLFIITLMVPSLLALWSLEIKKMNKLGN